MGVKVKRRPAHDVAGAALGARTDPRQVVIGLAVEGRLRIVRTYRW